MKSLSVDGRTDIVKAKGGVSKSVGIITLLPGRGRGGFDSEERSHLSSRYPWSAGGEQYSWPLLGSVRISHLQSIIFKPVFEHCVGLWGDAHKLD